MHKKTNRLSDQLTLEVTRSRDIEQAISNMYQFLKKHFPLNILSFFTHDPDLGTMHFKATNIDEKVIFVDEKIKLSAAGQKRALESMNKKIENWECPCEDPMINDICDHFELNTPHSIIRAIAKLDDSGYAGVSLDTFEIRAYKTKHFQLMENLFEALTVAVRYIIRQLEITSQKKRLIIELEELRKRLRYRIIGEQAGLQEVMSHVDKVASLDIPVLLIGETGVGKEVVANAIYQRSNRNNDVFISFNCGAIPDTLIESELYGYEKGAFTGATDMKFGYFEQADGGTVFMDEIGELSLKAQVKLLRFLQTMEFQRVGGKRPISIDTRIIAATNRNLEEMVNQELFRKDLWYRLNVYPIHIPPLRERTEDIPDLALYFARLKSIEMHLPYEFTFTPESVTQLQTYHWPGNIRELQNVIERALIVRPGEPLSFPELTESRSDPLKGKLPSQSHFPTMDELISQHIRKSLVLSKGKIDGPGGAAELLNLNPSTLRGKMRKFGIKVDHIPTSQYPS